LTRNFEILKHFNSFQKFCLDFFQEKISFARFSRAKRQTSQKIQNNFILPMRSDQKETVKQFLLRVNQV